MVLNVPKLIKSASRVSIDAAFEAFVRAAEGRGGWSQHFDRIESLTALAQVCALEKNADLRYARIISVLERMTRLKKEPDPKLLYTCFDVAAQSADVPLTCAIHETAFSVGHLRWPRKVDETYLDLFQTSALPGIVSDPNPPSVNTEGIKKSNLAPAILYYNGVIHAALCRRKHDLAATALRELHSTGAGPNADTVGLLAAAHAELDDTYIATELIIELEKKATPPPIAYAAVVRASGRQHDWGVARDWYLRAGNTPLSYVVTDAPFDATARCVAAAQNDVALATLMAARATKNVDGALWLLEDVRKRCIPSIFCLRIVFEMALSEGYSSIASQIAKEIELRAEKNNEVEAPMRIGSPTPNHR